MMVNYNEFEQFIEEMHPETNAKRCITILKRIIEASEIDSLDYFNGLAPKMIEKILGYSKYSSVFIEYLKSEGILHITEDKNQNIIERINKIVQQHPNLKKAANQLKFWLEVGTFKITDFEILTREEIQKKCTRKYRGPVTIDGIIFILDQLGITIKDEPPQTTVAPKGLER